MNKIQKFKIPAVIIILGLIAVWFGWFNVSAKDKHWSSTTSLLELVKERSIHARVEEGGNIPNMKDVEIISKGAKNYDAMCAQCHLSPESEQTELYLGLYPQPPVFSENKHVLHDPASTFWIIKNGLKMTGMPAWGDFHTDQQIWELVAFVGQLKGMDKEKYKDLVGEGGHSHGGESHHGDSTETMKMVETDGHGHSDDLQNNHDDLLKEKTSIESEEHGHDNGGHSD